MQHKGRGKEISYRGGDKDFSRKERQRKGMEGDCMDGLASYTANIINSHF